MGCGQSKTEQKVTKETRTAVSQSPQRADTTATQVEKTATTTTTTTTATNNTTGENADKKNAVGDVILVGKLKNKNAANTDTKDKETKETTTTTTTEKHTGDDGKEVKEVHEKTKEVKTAAPATTTATTTAAKRAADKKKNACADEVIDKIKLSSPTVKKREEREAAAFAERMLEQNGYVNDEQPVVTYVDPMNEEQPIINEPCEVYITPENNMTITSLSSNNNISQNSHPAEPSCNTSSSAQNSTSISPPPQPNENATPFKEPLVQTKVIATRVYEIDNGKSPEPIQQQSNVHQENKVVHEHGEHHSTTHPDHLHHSAAHHTSPETKEHNGSHRMSTPRRGSGSMPDGARGASKTTGTTHPTPKDKSSTARSLAKLHTTATSRLAQQYADQQQQQQQRRRSSSASQPHDEKQKTPEPKHEKIKPATKVATTTTTSTTPPPVMAGDSEHPHPHTHTTNTHHHHHSINNDKENNEVHHRSTHSASPESKPTKETCVVKTNEMNGTKNQSGKPASALEVTKLQQHQQQQQEKEEEKITMPEVVKDEQANDEANASENAEGQSSGPETSTLRQLYNRIASFTRILPTTPSRSQSQAQADSDATKQQVESVEQKKEEVVECQPEQPHPSHEPAVEQENEQKHQHHHRKHDEQEKEKQQQQKQKEKEEEEKKKKKKEEEEEKKKEEEQEDDDQQPESEQPPSHYWRHSQSISGPTSYAADNAPTLVKTANGTSKHNTAVKEPVPTTTTTTTATAAITTNTMHNKPLSEAVEREKLRHSRRTRKTAAQKYNVLYNLENDAASTITAQSYRPKYNHLVRAQAMNSKGSMASQRSAELKESTFEKKLRQREAEAQAEAGEQARAFSPEAATQPEEKPAGPMWVTVIPQDDAAVNMSGGWGLLRQIRTLIQLSHTAAV